MSRTQPAYWLLTGAVIGLGTLLFWEGGLLLMALGIGLALWRMARAGAPGLWLVLVGWGLLPGAYLLARYLLADRATEFFAPGYLGGVALLLALAAVGGGWGLLAAYRGRPAPR